MTTWRTTLTVATVAAAVDLGGAPAPATAQDVVRVTSDADPGDGSCATGGCTLREALAVVDDGDLATEVDRVEIAFDAALRTRIALASPLPRVDEALEIVGVGRFQPTVTAPSPAGPVLDLAPDVAAPVVVRGIVVAGGSTGIAAGVRAELTVSDVAVLGAGGAGILAAGPTLVRRSRVADHGGRGIVALGALVLRESTIAGNGGGGLSSTDSVEIRNSTITGNTTADSGGGLLLLGARQISIEDTTIVGNRADVDADQVGVGGGVRHDAFTAPRLRGVVLAGNRSGTGADDLRATGTRPAVDLAFSFVGTPVGGDVTESVPGSNVLGGGDPLLGPLAANGGATPTHLPLPGSPLLDRGGSARATDQRGVRGVQDAPTVADAAVAGATGSDIGAVEREVPPADPRAPAPAPSPGPAPVPEPAPATAVPLAPPAPAASGAPMPADPAARFGRRTLVTLVTVGRRVTRGGAVRVRLVNTNGFAVAGRLVVRRDARGARGAVRRVRIPARGRTTVAVRLPADARRALRRRGRAALRLTATVCDPTGTTRPVRQRTVLRRAR